ncbi:hypothetical protein GCM10010289_51640 [Streptomyces violascens]|uniref:Uncharacterized protein n=1 Tax=Streptomyces violascens TaxID=67381 RepID=A0ABQ3QQ13_9ACTN|nr:hypothetical protein GCM10010289_51640 [Streptomyces violascens]GHI39366.1 hypothetical protein Sviol_37740 [Streptomyces violascens]
MSAKYQGAPGAQMSAFDRQSAGPPGILNLTGRQDAVLLTEGDGAALTEEDLVAEGEATAAFTRSVGTAPGVLRAWASASATCPFGAGWSRSSAAQKPTTIATAPMAIVAFQGKR